MIHPDGVVIGDTAIVKESVDVELGTITLRDDGIAEFQMGKIKRLSSRFRTENVAVPEALSYSPEQVLAVMIAALVKPSCYVDVGVQHKVYAQSKNPETVGSVCLLAARSLMSAVRSAERGQFWRSMQQWWHEQQVMWNVLLGRQREPVSFQDTLDVEPAIELEATSEAREAVIRLSEITETTRDAEFMDIINLPELSVRDAFRRQFDTDMTAFLGYMWLYGQQEGMLTAIEKQTATINFLTMLRDRYSVTLQAAQPFFYRELTEGHEQDANPADFLISDALVTLIASSPTARDVYAVWQEMAKDTNQDVRSLQENEWLVPHPFDDGKEIRVTHEETYVEVTNGDAVVRLPIDNTYHPSIQEVADSVDVLEPGIRVSLHTDGTAALFVMAYQHSIVWDDEYEIRFSTDRRGNLYKKGAKQAGKITVWPRYTEEFAEIITPPLAFDVAHINGTYFVQKMPSIRLHEGFEVMKPDGSLYSLQVGDEVSEMGVSDTYTITDAPFDWKAIGDANKWVSIYVSPLRERGFEGRIWVDAANPVIRHVSSPVDPSTENMSSVVQSIRIRIPAIVEKNKAISQAQATTTTDALNNVTQAITGVFTNPDCYAMRSEYVAYAAETTRDGTCPTWGKSPRRVVRGMRNRSERERMDADARSYVRMLILAVPPIGFLVDGAIKAGIWYVTAPPPPPVTPQCTLGSCAVNGLCPAGQQCSATGCCTQLSAYEDFVCSVDKQYLLKRTMIAPGGFSIDINASFRCLDGCVNNDCAQKAQMTFPEQCTDAMKRTPLLYGFDSNYGAMNSCLAIDDLATMSYYREFTCSTDGLSVIERATGNVVRTCLGNQTCKQSGDIADCLGPVGYVRPQNAIIDMVCQGNDVYLFDSDTQTFTQHVASCPVRGCQQGACIAYEGDRCDSYAVAGATNINAHVSVDGMPISCNAEGNVVVADGLNKRVNVITGVNNIKNQVYDALALLPPGLMKKDFEIVVYPSGILYGDDLSWQSLWQRVLGSGRDNIGGVDNQTFPYHRRILLTEQQPELMSYAVIHEVMHAYAVDQLTIPAFVPLAGFYNMFSVGQHSNTPVGFHTMIGCKPDGSYDGVPFSDYPNPDCAEEFAEEGAGYVFKACELKAYNEDRYNYFKNEVFDGREYLPPQGCVN